MNINGLHFKVEQMGGGCTTLVAPVEGGTVVLSDGNEGHDVYALALGCDVSAAFYVGTTWTDEDQHEATHNAYAATPEAAVSALLDAVTAR